MTACMANCWHIRRWWARFFHQIVATTWKNWHVTKNARPFLRFWWLNKTKCKSRSTKKAKWGNSHQVQTSCFGWRVACHLWTELKLIRKAFLCNFTSWLHAKLKMITCSLFDNYLLSLGCGGKLQFALSTHGFWANKLPLHVQIFI